MDMRNGYKVRKDANSGMVVLTNKEWSNEVAFGGAPAIQVYAAENPELPKLVINELLALDAGFSVTLEKDGGWKAWRPDAEPGFVLRALSADGAWALAAEEAIRLSDAHALAVQGAAASSDQSGSPEDAESDLSAATKINVAYKVPAEVVEKIEAHLHDVATSDPGWNGVNFVIERDDYTCIPECDTPNAAILLREILNIIDQPANSKPMPGRNEDAKAGQIAVFNSLVAMGQDVSLESAQALVEKMTPEEHHAYLCAESLSDKQSVLSQAMDRPEMKMSETATETITALEVVCGEALIVAEAQGDTETVEGIRDELAGLRNLTDSQQQSLLDDLRFYIAHPDWCRNCGTSAEDRQRTSSEEAPGI